MSIERLKGNTEIKRYELLDDRYISVITGSSLLSDDASHKIIRAIALCPGAKELLCDSSKGYAVKIRYIS